MDLVISIDENEEKVFNFKDFEIVVVSKDNIVFMDEVCCEKLIGIKELPSTSEDCCHFGFAFEEAPEVFSDYTHVYTFTLEEKEAINIIKELYNL